MQCLLEFNENKLKPFKIFILHLDNFISNTEVKLLQQNVLCYEIRDCYAYTLNLQLK